jgi:hypothetical protein
MEENIFFSDCPGLSYDLYPNLVTHDTDDFEEIDFKINLEDDTSKNVEFEVTKDISKTNTTLGKKYLREHPNHYSDNTLGIIKTHFKHFIIDFLNDYIKDYYGYQKRRFRKFSHKGVTIEKMKEFMEMTISDMCKLDLDGTFSKPKKNQNQKFLKAIPNENLINYKLKDFYILYYQSDKSNFPFLSDKAKNFFDLIEEKEGKLKNKIEKLGFSLISDYITKESKSKKHIHSSKTDHQINKVN